MGFCNCSMFYCALLCVHSSFAIILMGRESWLLRFVCLPGGFVIAVWLFLTIPRVCLQFVIVVFPDHTRLLIFYKLFRGENIHQARIYLELSIGYA